MTPWVKSLLTWFATEQRPMPWRETPSAYGTWISEMMLQQTQVSTVIPYFKRFMTQFPTIDALAEADEQQVLKAWEGLGYYSRARNLHKAAKMLVRDYNSQLPEDYDELQKLPGIGPYCAAAITSIAFSNSVPVVDGNVLRVFTRFWGIFDDIRHNVVKEMLFHKLSHFVTQANPSDFNQAIMECGALICTPKQVKCNCCPISRDCFAFNNKKVDELPFKSKKPPTPHYTIAIGVVFCKGKVLIGQRKTDQMLGGLWEFPGGKQEDNEVLEQTVRRELLEECNIVVDVKHCIKVVKHAYSHFKITLHAFHCDYVSGTLESKSAEQLRWVRVDELDEYPFPKANKAVLDVLFA